MNTTNLLLQCNSWVEFTNQVRKLNQKKKGDCFEALTIYYFQLHPNYATKLEHVWHLANVPIAISKYLNLPGPDEGIDLVAQTKEGDYWAIQCKFRDDETKSLSRRELATFTDLAFGICKNFQLAIVCTTADRLSRKLELYGERLSFLCGDRWRELDDEFFQRLHWLIQGKLKLPKPFKPRPHQLRAIQNAQSHFIENGNERGKLIMPCGTGKSLAAYWIAEKLEAHSILIAVPSLALIRQTLEVWTRESLANQREIQWICVCSDTSVADAHDEDIAVLSQDLGVQIHTNPDEIAGWLNKVHDGLKVVITTYQSGKALSEAVSKEGFVFDLGILDEAHKTVGRKDNLFSHLLYDENVKIKKRVFMTATERRYQGQSEQITSMDDPKLYGDTFEILPFKSALEQNPPILCDYNIMTIMVSRSEIRDLIRRNLFVRPDKGKWDEDVEAEMLASAVALRKAMLKHPISHSISFHSSIARAKAFKGTQDILTSSFPKYGELQTFHVSGSMPTSVRKKEIDIFESATRGLITNARCLTEGVDVPNIDCVLFADPRKSTIDIVQAVGRALRPARGKELAYVIIPVLADDNAGAGSLRESGVFDTVLTTLRALAANDDRIVEYFRSVSKGRTHQRGKATISIDLPLGVEIDAEAFVESIELKIWSRLAKLSWRPFELARAFVQTLSLKNRQEWTAFCRGNLPSLGALPDDIPMTPDRIYADRGWISVGDWLGSGTIASQLRKYRPFDQAREFVRRLGLKSVKEWTAFCKGKLPHLGTLPEDIPIAPHQTYANKGWIGMGDWLGTGTVAPFLREYRPFNQARTYVQSLGLKSIKDWVSFCGGKLSQLGGLPPDIPASPEHTYADKGWTNWGDWLGTGTVANYLKEYRPFDQARVYARKLGFKNVKQWNAFCGGKLIHLGTLPDDIPSNPYKTYADNGWVSWGDWLGTRRVAPRFRQYRPLNEAKTFIHNLGLRNTDQWKRFCKGLMTDKGTLPQDIPATPDRTYKNKGWISWGDWLGTGIISPSLRKYRPFEQARTYIKTLGLKSVKEWTAFCKGNFPLLGALPDDIPAAPDQVYRNKGWKSWGDWLGSGTVAPFLNKYRPFEQARTYAQTLGLKSYKEWISFCRGKLPNLGTLPTDIPSYANQTYAGKGWVGWGDWLGTRRVANYLRHYRPFREARAYAQTLGLKSAKQWVTFCQGNLPNLGTLPDDIPVNVDRTYRYKGWISWEDWLG